ncbi:hypothetical protein [Litorihabitans aurantiacus]|uniref:SnoaL-like domain-containing protein n=1 Tax=Litorihabitans aurantiacus TaxID=1930061 RepID=A0AA37XH33_9MICO|nr:hypothetical protein [Litorihabitans aurantiacus]GMA33421.1 hypothetical protein GCM10025875_34130 [Litorihabitans aurantiacus]
MTRGGRYVRGAAGIAAVGLIAGGLVACSPDDPPEPTGSSTATTSAEPSETETETPSPTASESETPTLTPEEQNIEAAKATVVEYYAAQAEVGAANFENWAATLLPYWGTVELTDYWGSVFAQAETDQLRTEGTASVEDFRATPTPGVDGRPSVQVTYCENNEAVRIYLPDGSEIPKAGQPRTSYSAVIEHRESGNWVFITLDQTKADGC